MKAYLSNYSTPGTHCYGATVLVEDNENVEDAICKKFDLLKDNTKFSYHEISLKTVKIADLSALEVFKLYDYYKENKEKFI